MLNIFITQALHFFKSPATFIFNFIINTLISPQRSARKYFPDV